MKSLCGVQEFDGILFAFGRLDGVGKQKQVEWFLVGEI